MRRSTRLALVLTAAAAVSAGARADDAPPPAPPATTPEAPAAPAAQDPAAEYRALLAEVAAARTAWLAEQRAAIDAAKKAAEEATARGEKPAPIPAMQMAGGPAPTFIPRFAEFAARHADAPQAVDALLFVLTNGAALPDASAAKAALATLLDRHVDDARIQGTVAGLQRYAALVGDTAKTWEDVAARSKSADVRAAAVWAPVSQVFALGSKASAEDRAAARGTAERVAKEYPETRWGRRAAGTLNEMDHLQVGMTAPDFEGKDAEGRTLRLSDFRGKVVLLDYWGYW